MKCARPYWLVASGDRRFFVPCGKCLYCRIQRRKLWTMRMMHERETCGDACFITLTYSDENKPARGVVKKDLQDFFKRFRKVLAVKIKYFACGEYGERTMRPHYHAIIFGLSVAACRLILDQCWRLGRVDIGEAEADSIRYVAQYVDKKFDVVHGKELEFNGLFPPFQIQSQGLGLNFFLQNIERFKEDRVFFRGKSQKVARYYLKKLEEFDPVVCEEFRAALVKKAEVVQADYLLERRPDLGGVTFKEVDEDVLREIMVDQYAKGKATDMFLKAQAKNFYLKKKEKRL